MTWRDVALVVLSLIIAPPLGAVILVVGDGLLAGGAAVLGAFDTGFLMMALLFSYPIAWAPAVLMGVVNAILSRYLHSEGQRLLAALPVGAFAYLGLIGWLNEDGSGYSITGSIALAAGGALGAMLPVAILEAFDRRSA